MRLKTNRGYFLVEALLSVVIFVLLVIPVFSMVSFLQNRTTRSTFESDAALLLQDGMEIAHSALLADWNGYPEGTYYPAFDADSGAWLLSPGTEDNLQTRYTRAIEIEKVCRDSSGLIIQRSDCTGEIDPRVRYVVTTLSWVENDMNKEVTARLLVLNANE